MNKIDLKYFFRSMRDSPKARTLGYISINVLYIYDTNLNPLTTRNKETMKFIVWKRNVWRPFCKTITNEDWKEWNIEPSIGREGMIAIFRYMK